MTHQRCPNCFREEKGGSVLQAGGGRRPVVVAELAAWRVFYAAMQGQTGPVTVPCVACGLPMVQLDGQGDSHFWPIATAAGTVVPGHPTVTPEGSMPLERANHWMEDKFSKIPATPRQSHLGALWFVYLLVPTFLWLSAVFFLLLLLFVAVGANFMDDVIDFPFRAVMGVGALALGLALFQATRKR